MRIRRALSALVGCAALIMLALVARGQESDREAFRKLHNELRQRMTEDLAAAAKYLESQIADSPESADLNVLRHSVATKFLEQSEFKKANQQFKKLLDFQIKHIDESENQFGVWLTVQSIQDVADNSGDTTALVTAVDQAFAALQTVDVAGDQQPLAPISQLAVVKAQLMAKDKKVDEATEFIQQQLTKLTDIHESEKATQQSTQTLVRMLRALTSPDRGNDSWRDQFVSKLDEVVTAAIDRFPNSAPLQTAYAETQYLMITRWQQDDPEATKKRMEEVSEKLDLIALKNRGILATLRRLEVYKERMAAAKPVETLVGKPAPEWEIDAWVNVIGMSRETFQGKVVLIDFWAMWCGPCIATFPHLREWRDEFGDQDFEIVGVTSYYNFEWDEENKRAARSDDDVSPEDERDTLASFLKHHQLEHPVFVSPEGSKMSGEYGVRGIPHVVLIDRKGVVQLVKTGAGQATADEIHGKIKELLKAKE